MALLEDKIDEIRDPKLREVILDEVKKLKKDNKFGLVFEEHIPELASIPSTPIRPRAVVALKTGNLNDTYSIADVNDSLATVIKDADGTVATFPVSDLVTVKRFGEPIYPSLVPVELVENGGETPYHVIIEADNYHALQLLEYLYADQVDVIYIDPPYNTGARDWKYNNNYVDKNDAWRHSKWLSMMRKRLLVAKRLLNSEGVLICTIDDHEIHHLMMLLESLFPDREIFTVVIEHNKRGRQGEDFARTHEYAFFVAPKHVNVIQEEKLPFVIGGETRNLRRTGNNSLRSARPNQFYPVYVNPQTLDITRVGEPIPLGSERFEQLDNGCAPIWPIDKQGIERNWHYGAERTREGIAQKKIYAQRMNYGIQIYYTLREKSTKKRKTVWSNNSLLDASTHGSEMLTKILGRTDSFAYPKSVYAVKDCLAAACGNNPDALVLDFFAGSGTTLHSLLLLNNEDGGNRRCILITNNEVSEDEATSLAAKGFLPGDSEWEANGICRSVAFPRCKYMINGYRDDGTPLDGVYLTGRVLIKETSRSFHHLGFVDLDVLNVVARKKEIAGIIDGIPMSHIKADTAYFVSDQERHTASILFDINKADEYLNALQDMEHITRFYIVAKQTRLFEEIKSQINKVLGPNNVEEEEKLPMSEGFSANLAYFRLNFLDPTEVALGEQFTSILPILWLQAGAKGTLAEPEDNLPYFIPDDSPLAVLIDETRFREFQEAINGRDDLTHIYLITDSEDAFFEMKEELAVSYSTMLYEEYLENFKINAHPV